MAYTYEEAAKSVIQAGQELVKRGLVARTWGNISARISDTHFLITPSGQSYDTLTPEKLVAVSIADCSYTGDIRPSGEKGVHAEAYKYHRDVNFVIHTHQTFATALSVMGRDIELTDERSMALMGEKIICGEYAISSTRRLMKRMSDAIQKNPLCYAFLMKNHGMLCLGNNDRHAFAISTETEEICKRKIAEQLKIGTFTEEGLREAFRKKAETGVYSLHERNGEKRRARIGKETDVAAFLKNRDEIQTQLRETGKAQAVRISENETLRTFSETGAPLYPMIDDMAQIVGTKINCVTPDTPMKKMAEALEKQNALFLRGVGAICVGADEDEARAVEQVLRKDVTCHMYALCMNAAIPLESLDAAFQRKNYVKNYSKQMSQE